jgi:hypothetical protein
MRHLLHRLDLVVVISSITAAMCVSISTCMSCGTTAASALASVFYIIRNCVLWLDPKTSSQERRPRFLGSLAYEKICNLQG